MAQDPANPANIHPAYNAANLQVFNAMYQAAVPIVPAIGIQYSENDFNVEKWKEFYMNIFGKRLSKWQLAPFAKPLWEMEQL